MLSGPRHEWMKRSDGNAASRQGFTLAELIIVMVLGTLVLALVIAVGTRLQRQLAILPARVASDEQLRGAAAILPLDVRGVSSPAGDIRAGEARDTSLEFRATIASAIVCATTENEVVLSLFANASRRPAGATVQAGDTLWILVDADSAESWRAIRARSVRGISAGCSPLAVGSPQNVELFALEHPLAIGVAAEEIAVVAPGVPVRITRPTRYSIYRASDNQWYLGLRNWSSGTGQFAQVQPVSGPYLPPALTGSATRFFSYYDSMDALIVAGTSETARIARVEVNLATDAAQGTRDSRHDSLAFVVALRNRK